MLLKKTRIIIDTFAYLLPITFFDVYYAINKYSMNKYIWSMFGEINNDK